MHNNIDTIFDTFSAAGHEVYLVGGSVRNHFLGLPTLDYDFAVSCPPEVTQEVLAKADIAQVPTGLSHGTITAVFGKDAYEITSFRKDLITNGRHAITEFGGTIVEDAMRRDFTMNALYMDQDRNLIDPLNVKSDLDERRLRFVGDARARVQEDYLRILRFFRFFAQYDLEPDEEAIAACQEFAGKLKGISAERIGHEMRKLMGAKNSRRSLDLAKECNVTPIVLPEFQTSRFAHWKLYRGKNDLRRDWRVATLCATDKIPLKEWRLSNQEYRFMYQLKTARDSRLPPSFLGEEFGEEIAIWALHMRANCGEYQVSCEDIEAVRLGAHAEFPVNGHDLLEIGYQGPNVGKLISKLKTEWRASNYRLDKNTLLQIAKGRS